MESGLGVEDGISRIRADLYRVFRFSDEKRFSRQSLRDCYAEFESWLNKLMITEPPPDGVAALFFGLYEEDGKIGISLSGSRRWSLEDPAWACDTWYLPQGGQIEPDVYRDICSAFSEFNQTGLYLSITLLAAMIREYTRKSVISLLDINRSVLYIACGYVDGDLYNVGKLTEAGLQAPRHRFSLFR
jgi:hypothetical protein